MSDCSARDAYRDQSSSAEARQTYEAHLATCAACQAAVAQWKTFGASLRTAYEPLHQAPSPGEIARLKAKAEAPARRPVLGWALVGGMALLAIGVAVQLLRPPPEV